MIGIDFSQCNQFILSFQFADCQLNLASFFKMKLKSMSYDNCELKEVDFVESDLSGSAFHNCDLSGAMFERTNLEKVDFRTAHGYSIDPDLNKIKKAKFSITGSVGLLSKYDITIE